MAIVACKECNAEMSSSASKCQKCGKPRTTVSGVVLGVLFGLGAFVLLTVLMAHC